MKNHTYSKLPALFELYESLFDNNPDACYALDAKGHFILLNDSALKLTGYDRNNLIMSPYKAIIHHSEVSETEKHFSEALNGGKISFNTKITDKDGKTIDLYVTATAVYTDGKVSGVIGVAQDISYQNQIQHELLQSRNQLQNIFDSLEVCIWSAAPNHQQVYHISPACLEIFGYSQDEFLQDPGLWISLIHPEDLQQTNKMQDLLNEGKPIRHDYRIIHKDGSVKWIFDYTVPILDKTGIVIRLDGVITDITEKKHYEKQLEFMAYHDPLTKLPNRRMFQARLAETITFAHASETKVAILYLDLDRFKTINDTLGHAAGDNMLRIAASRLRASITERDLVARLSGDEFAVILAYWKDVELVYHTARNIIDSLGEPFHLYSGEFILSTSIGISIYPDHSTSPEDLIRLADQAMYHAKINGKGSFQVYHENLTKALNRKIKLEQDLRQGIKRNELSLHYQPVIHVPTMSVLGFEALIRWNHSVYGFISPAEFIPIAEESGFIIVLGDWILETACHQIQVWQMKGFNCHIAVNISLKQLEDEYFTEKVKMLLNKFEVDPKLLKMEVTEGLAMKDPDLTFRKIQQLQQLGIDIYLDDFGTGYSSLSYLNKLPFKKLKIDQSFVRDIALDPGSESIIKTIVAMASSLRMGIIAEGVETDEQSSFLCSIGCEKMQGYKFGRPMPAIEAETLLR